MSVPENRCLQCGFEIAEQRDDHFCSDGCREVHDKVRELDERFAMQEGQ